MCDVGVVRLKGKPKHTTGRTALGVTECQSKKEFSDLNPVMRHGSKRECLFVYFVIHLFTHLCINYLIYLSIRFIHSIHVFIYLFIYLFIHSFIYSFVFLLLIYLSIYIDRFIYSFIHSLTSEIFVLFICLFINSLSLCLFLYLCVLFTFLFDLLI